MRRTICDRCDREIYGVTDPLYVVTEPYNPNGGARSKGDAKTYDLCKSCAATFGNWINPPRAAK